MIDKHDAKMSSGELSHLWEQYMNNNMASIFLNYLVKKIDCEDTLKVCSFALMNVEADLNLMKKIYEQENFPLPEGFGEQDMNPNAPKPVTDEFVLFYLLDMSKLDLALTSISLSDATRYDLRELYRNRLVKAMELHDKSTSLLLEKGLYVRPPIITSTHEAKPMADQGFISNWFGNDPRTLTAREANELHKNILLNYHGKCLLMVLHQTNKNKDLRKLILKGKELASHIMKLLSNVLIENDLPVSMTSDTHILDTTESPFSDKLICRLIDQLNKYGIASYGYAAAVSSRKDLKLLYGRIIGDVYQYEEEIKSFMIKNKWLERPPVALDRRILSEI